MCWSLPCKWVLQVTDIIKWVQCFAGSKYPVVVPELLAYLLRIVKCAREFEGISWVHFDQAYHKQLKEFHWSRINPTLFSLFFAGKAKWGLNCPLSLSDSHTAEGCPDNMANRGNWTLSIGKSTPFLVKKGVGSRSKVHFLFNKPRKCHFNKCKYEHVCSVCRGDHPPVKLLHRS